MFEGHESLTSFLIFLACVVLSLYILLIEKSVLLTLVTLFMGLPFLLLALSDGSNSWGGYN